MIIPTIAFLSGCNGIWPDRDDKLEKWELLGLEGEDISAIQVDPFDEDVIYAGSGSNFSLGKVGGFFKSTDGGASWDTLIRGVTVRDIDIHPFNSQVIYLTGGTNYLTPFGIFKTTDGGMSFFRIDTSIHYAPEEGPDVLAIDPLYTDTVYAGTGGEHGGNLYKSTDGGQRWLTIGNDIMDMAGVVSLAFDPNSTEVLYAGTADIGALFKSIDGGQSWSWLDFPEVGIIYDLVVNHLNSKIVYAGTSWRHGFYVTRDSGVSWEMDNSGLPDSSAIHKIVLAPTGEIYIAANKHDKGAVYKSAQGNIEWTITGNTELGRINTVTSSNKGKIYAGATGIYLLSD